MFDVVRGIRRSATIALLISPVGILVIAAARLLIIANYNTATAAAIVTSTGYVNALLGTVIPLVPIFLPYLALLLLFSRRFVAGSLCLLAAAFVSPTSATRSVFLSTAAREFRHTMNWTHEGFLIQALVGLLIIVTLVLLFCQLANFWSFVSTVGILLSIPLAIFVVRLYPFPLGHSYYTQFIRQPWLAEETVAYGHGSSVTGFNLSADGTYMEFLKASSRKVTYIYEPSIRHWRICQQGSASSIRSLISIGAAPVQLPACTPPARPIQVFPPGRYMPIHLWPGIMPS
jgi:hypothetical protein